MPGTVGLENALVETVIVAMPPLAMIQNKSVEPFACPDGVVEGPCTDKQTPHSTDMPENP